MPPPPGRTSTGDDALDHALGGGLPRGTALLVEGPDGAGSTEFGFTMLRATASAGNGATFASALRSPERVAAEYGRLFPAAGPRPRIVALRASRMLEDCTAAAGRMGAGEVLVVESAAALERALPPGDLVQLFQSLAESTLAAGAVLVLLHAPGTLGGDRHAAIAELADAVFSFTLREGVQSHRRALTLRKLRGLAPALAGDQVPVFEAGLREGIGLSVTSVKSVV